MDVAQFRLDFPEFASETIYTSNMVNFWASIAVKMLDLSRWGDLYTQGQSLYVAHNLVIQRRNIAGAGSGGSTVTGAISSKSVGSVSVSYDNQIATMPNAGQWALTVYGLQYLQLARLIGAGAVQL
jgi:hypothetical protein